MSTALAGWARVIALLDGGAVAVVVGCAARRVHQVGQVNRRLTAAPEASRKPRWSRFDPGRARRMRTVSAALPAGLEAVSRSLRSGASLPGALVEASTSVPGVLGVELGRLAQQLTLGRPLDECLDDWVHRNPTSDVRLAAGALGLAVETGGARSRALDGLAQSVRDRQALRLEVTALASQARLSAIVMALLPVAFLTLTTWTDEDVRDLLFSTRLGVVCLGGGVVLDALGLWWMQLLVRRS